jgi:serine protease Do
MDEFDKDSKSFDEQETGELRKNAESVENSTSDSVRNSFEDSNEDAYKNSTSYGNTSTRDYLNQMAQRAQQQAYENSGNHYDSYGNSGYYTENNRNVYGSYGSQNGYNYNAGTNQQAGGYAYNGTVEPADAEDAAGRAARKAAEKVRKKEEKKSERAQKKYNRKNNKKSDGRVARFAKKATGLVAAAAVFGLVAGGVFQYIAKDTLAELKNSGSTEVSSEQSTDIASTESIQNKDTTLEATTVLDSASGMDVSAIASNAMPSVVAIHITAIEEVDQGFFGSYQYETEGSGSGIIIDENDDELLIVTNNHVVSDAETVSVDFIDGETYDAKVKGTDSDSDLAIVVVPLADLSESTLSQIKIAQLGDSDSLQVGEQVVAIGNALGYGQSVTTGIVSALNRVNSTNTTPLIQTDAAINPGNSGGALLNMKGELIGINSSKYADTDVEGMGYAIPVSSVTDVIENLKNMKTREKVDEDEMGYLGIECGTVTSEMQYYYGAPAGVYVSKVTDGLAADKAGIPENSIITSLDGKSVSSVDDLTSVLEYYAAGETIEVKYSVMKNNEYVEKSAEVTLGEKPSN